MWEYDPYHSSIITGGNGGSKPTRTAFTLFYNQGAGKYELEQTLNPDEQMWVDVGKLIREHIPDKNGKTLPAGVTSGSFEIRDLTNTGIGSLFEGKIVYDKTYGHVTYGCSICCGYQYPFLTEIPLPIPFLNNAQNWVYAYEPCADINTDVTYWFAGNWSTGNTAIATVDAGGNHTGVGVGSTITDVWANLESSNYRTCPLRLASPSGGDNVNPVITGISPSTGLIGTTTSKVTVNGKGFTGGTVNVPTAMTVSNVITTDTQIVADFVVASNATPGNNAVTVTAGGQTSNAVNFFVQVPTTLSIVPGTGSTTSESSCSAGSFGTGCGVTRSFIYQVNDQAGQPIQVAGLQVWDQIQTTSPNTLNLTGYNTTCSPANTGPCGVTTNSAGQFGENNPGLSVCSTVCRVNNACTTGGPTNATQTVHVGAFTITQNLSYYCDHILVNGQ